MFLHDLVSYFPIHWKFCEQNRRTQAYIAYCEEKGDKIKALLELFLKFRKFPTRF